MLAAGELLGDWKTKLIELSKLKKGPLPSWLPTETPGMSQAVDLLKSKDPDEFLRLLRKVGNAMEKKLHHFATKYPVPVADQESLSAVPASNDYLESFMGTFRWLGERLGPQLHPRRLCGLSMIAHTRRSLLALNFSGFTEAHLAEARLVPQETFADCYRRVYITKKLLQLENALGKQRVNELHQEAATRGIDIPSHYLKADLVEALVTHHMEVFTPPEPPCASTGPEHPPKKRQKGRE